MSELQQTVLGLLENAGIALQNRDIIMRLVAHAEDGKSNVTHSKSDTFDVRDFLLGRVTAWERNALGEDVEQVTTPRPEGRGFVPCGINFLLQCLL